jgi:hypothetical protein
MRRWWLAAMVAGCTGSGGSGDPIFADADVDGDDDDHPIDTGTIGTDPFPDATTTSTNEVCVLLYGGNDRVRGPDEGLPLEDDPRTMQAWIRTHDLDEQIAVSYGRPSPNQGFMLGTIDGYAHARAGSGNAMVQGTVFVADDEWHHVAVAYDGRLTVVIVDGEVAGVGEIDIATLEGDVVAGNTPTGDLTKPFVGWLDDVRIFEGARKPDEISADYDGEDVDPSALVLWWDFELDEGTSGPGVTVPDESGNGHHGTTGGAGASPEFPRCR